MTATTPRDTTTFARRDELSAGQREEMFALLAAHFEGVSRQQFDRDLDEKNWVIQIQRNGCLRGFSTLLSRMVEVEGVAVTAIYSGDTIVAPEAWNSPALARAWIAAVNQIRSAAPGRRCYWLLLSSGFRTYRLLSVFWREFFPHRNAATPLRMQCLLAHLAGVQYGDAYDAAANLVRFPRPQILRPELRAIPAGRDADPDVAYFLAQNPGHARGDELVCITEVSEANLTRAGQRMVCSAQ
jgi:hypothetical protein